MKIHHGGARGRREDLQRHHEASQESHRKGVSLTDVMCGCVRAVMILSVV